MPKDINNPDTIRFLKELYESEKKARSRWLFKHEEKLKMAATLDREPNNYFETDVVKFKMTEGLNAITQGHINAANLRRKVPLRDAASMVCAKDIRHDHSIEKIGLGNTTDDPRLARPDTSSSIDPVMRPVARKIKKIIYKSRPEFGRELYLHKRAEEMPEKKYYFSECTNWDYGWRLGDNPRTMGSEYGRNWLLHRSLNSRVGPQPDPRHYKSADKSQASKCYALENYARC